MTHDDLAGSTCFKHSWIVIPIIFIVLQRSSQVSDPWTEDARWCRRVVVAGRPNENSDRNFGSPFETQTKTQIAGTGFQNENYASLKANENLKKDCSAPPGLSIFLFHAKCSIMQYNSNQDFIASERKKDT